MVKLSLNAQKCIDSDCIKRYGEIRSSRKFNIFRLEIGTYNVFFYCMTCFCGKCPSWRIFLLFLFWMINTNVVFFYNGSYRLIKPPPPVQGWQVFTWGSPCQRCRQRWSSSWPSCPPPQHPKIRLSSVKLILKKSACKAQKMQQIWTFLEVNYFI